MGLDSRFLMLYTLQTDQRMFGAQIADLVRSGKYPRPGCVLSPEEQSSCMLHLSCLILLIEDQNDECINLHNLGTVLA